MLEEPAAEAKHILEKLVLVHSVVRQFCMTKIRVIAFVFITLHSA